LENKVARFLLSSKDAPKKMQFLGTIKKLASLFPRLQNAKWRKTPADSSKQNRSASQCCCIFQEPLNRGKYAYVGLFGKIWLWKKFLSFCLLPNQARLGGTDCQGKWALASLSCGMYSLFMNVGIIRRRGLISLIAHSLGLGIPESFWSEVWRAMEKGERDNRARYGERGRWETDRMERSIESEGGGRATE